MTKQFIDEVNQEIKEERIVTFWKKYKYAVIGGIALIIGGTGVNVGYDTYTENQKVNQAISFEKFLNGNGELLNELSNGNEGVHFITTIEQARRTSLKGDNKQASEMLYSYSKSAESPQKDYAILTSIWLGVGEINTDELLTRLESVTVPEYKTLKLFTLVELYLQQKQFDKATEVLKLIEGDLTLADEYRNIVKELILVTSQ